MFKKLLVISLFLVLTVSVFAGQLTNAAKSNPYVMIYIYTPECSLCKKFSPRYESIKKQYNKELSFVKLNGYEPEGIAIMTEFGARFVPYIVLYNSKKNIGYEVNFNCFYSTKCTEEAIKHIKKS